jgi:hypothetical protein
VYKPEIDEVLKRHLGRVTAPEELWERMDHPPVSARAPQARMRALLALAAMLLIAAVVFHPRRELRSPFPSEAEKARIIGTRVVQGAVELDYRLPEHDMTLRVSKASEAPEALNTACLLCHAGV